MSLKAFHVVFIAASFALSLWFGVYSLQQWRGGDAMYLWFAIGSFAVAIAIIPYSIWFLRKLKRVSYL